MVKFRKYLGQLTFFHTVTLLNPGSANLTLEFFKL